jgi:MscS family membrane protein
MQAFVEGIRALIQANDHTRKDLYEVHMAGFGASSLDVLLYFFLAVDSWQIELRERHRIFLEVMRLARSLDISFAFPTQTLHLDYVNEPGKARSLPQVKDEKALADVVHAFAANGARSRPLGPQLTHGYMPEPLAVAPVKPDA